MLPLTRHLRNDLAPVVKPRVAPLDGRGAFATGGW